jgi:putative oxidoreductase
LLLLRLGIGIALIYLAATTLSEGIPEPIFVSQNLIAAAFGIFIIAGLWTPVTGTLAAIDQCWIALSLPSSERSGELIHILLAVLSAGVAMLGPGAWSIDARLFGRRRLYRDRAKG